MTSANSATNNMHLLISFIAFFAIYSVMVNAELDVNIMGSDAKIHEHDASYTSDSSFFDNQPYLHNINDDVESVPINGNTSISNLSGRLYNYDDYMGSIDMYPDPNNNYDYGERHFLCQLFNANFFEDFHHFSSLILLVNFFPSLGNHICVKHSTFQRSYFFSYSLSLNRMKKRYDYRYTGV